MENSKLEEQRDQAIGLLEEARDGLDPVLSELEQGEELADSDSRVRKAMDQIHKADGIIRWLYEDSETWTDSMKSRVNKRFIENAHEHMSPIFEPSRADEISSIIYELNQVMLYLKSCNFEEITK